MVVDEDKLRAFGRLVVRLQAREDLTREEAHGAFRQIWRNEQPELQQGAFIATLRAKGETREELSGVVDAFQEEWQRFFPHVVKAPEPHLSIAGIGMDSLKTVNVSSGAAVIAAACGVYVHKPGAPALTGVSGAADMFALWGVDVDAPGEAQVRSTERCRLGFTSVVGRAFARAGFGRVLSQLRIGTTIHIAGPLTRHVGERHKIAGVPEPVLTRKVCEVMRDLGYARALVPCGASTRHPGRYLDELSIIGPTHMAELLPDGSIVESEIRPADAGLEEATYEDIASRPTAEENARWMARVLAGKEQGPVLDLLLLNAAAGLLLMGKVADLKEGVARARRAVAEGAAYAQLRALLEAQNAEPRAGLARLEKLVTG
jgi:anthranilate phosphoribosyltransferase